MNNLAYDLHAIEYTEADKAEARDNAIDYVLGSENAMLDVLSGEFGNNARLSFLMTKMATSNRHTLQKWVDEYKAELAQKLEVLIQKRIPAELERLY